jgi:hypothetical protein
MDDATHTSDSPLAAARGAGVAPPWYARRRFWRSVAGMALAVVMACAIVRMEMRAAGRRHRRRHPAGHRQQARRAPSASGSPAP